jgi:16S rRNA (uracil1498-N3)-methyltransferase
MTILVLPEDIEKRKGIWLSADKSHYLVSVLRCREGDAITVIDGTGSAYIARIARITERNVLIDIAGEKASNAESLINLILCQSILKGDKMDFVIQKATELGVKEIIPIITKRTLVKNTRKVGRWRKIAEEAAEQCGRTVIPAVHEPIDLDLLFTVHDSQQMNGFIFWEEGGISLKEAIKKLLPSPSLHNSNTPIFVLVGPEGGWTVDEVKLAESHGFVRTTLGRRILRAETAAIISLALVQLMLE